LTECGRKQHNAYTMEGATRETNKETAWISLIVLCQSDECYLEDIPDPSAKPAPLSSSVLKRRYISIQNKRMTCGFLQ